MSFAMPSGFTTASNSVIGILKAYWPSVASSSAEKQSGCGASNSAPFCHLGALAGFVFPMGNVIVPLVIWMIKKEDMPFVDDQGKELPLEAP